MNLTKDERDEKAEMDYRDSVQEEIDSKKAYSGLSPEELSLQDAAIEGRRAGHLGLSAGLNPYQCGCPEHEAWENARTCVIGAWLSNLRRIA